MASYHCNVGGGGKSQGGGGTAHAEYIEREGKYKNKDRYEDLEAKDHGNLPEWANNQPAEFWKAADQYERANGVVYREFEVALPRELNPDQRRELVKAFVAQEIGEQHAYQWSIHCPKAALEGREQPHAHIMYSERIQDGIARSPEQYFKRANTLHPERGGCKKSDRFTGNQGGGPQAVSELRQRWADLQNQHLERHGHATRVDHRSLADQGIERAPERHLGRAGIQRLSSDDRAALLERRAAETAHEQTQLDLPTAEVSADLVVAREQAEKRDVMQWFETEKENIRKALDRDVDFIRYTLRKEKELEETRNEKILQTEKQSTTHELERWLEDHWLGEFAGFRNGEENPFLTPSIVERISASIGNWKGRFSYSDECYVKREIELHMRSHEERSLDYIERNSAEIKNQLQTKIDAKLRANDRRIDISIGVRAELEFFYHDFYRQCIKKIDTASHEFMGIAKTEADTFRKNEYRRTEELFVRYFPEMAQERAENIAVARRQEAERERQRSRSRSRGMER